MCLSKASTVADGAGPHPTATMVQLGLDSVLSSTDMLGSTAKTKARHPLDLDLGIPQDHSPKGCNAASRVHADIHLAPRSCSSACLHVCMQQDSYYNMALPHMILKDRIFVTAPPPPPTPNPDSVSRNIEGKTYCAGGVHIGAQVTQRAGAGGAPARRYECGALQLLTRQPRLPPGKRSVLCCLGSATPLLRQLIYTSQRGTCSRL